MGYLKDVFRNAVEKMNLRTALVADLQCSIARDCLQAERSLLLYCKFAATLGFVSLAILFDYRFGSSDIQHSNESSPAKKFSVGIGIIFFVLSMGSLVLGVYNYFNNVYHYVNERTRVGSRVPTNLFLSLVVIALLATNIALLVDAYE